MTVVDTHQHNWDLKRFTYRWIQPQSVLAQNYLPEDAQPVMQATGVDQCVLVEAGVNALAETIWFLELAAHHAHIAGVVGYLDLGGDVAAQLAALPAARPYLKGVRIGLADPDFELDTLRAGLQTRAANGLTCDLLIRNQALSRVAELAATHPNVTFILDHFAGATLRTGGHQDWQKTLEPAAYLPNTVMKVSGYLTAADPMPPDADLIRPYFDIALNLFGPDRLMYGSDWPVCLRGASYATGVTLLQELTAELSPAEQAAIWGQTAVETYHL
jgi:L-fuconolactonase